MKQGIQEAQTRFVNHETRIKQSALQQTSPCLSRPNRQSHSYSDYCLQCPSHRHLSWAYSACFVPFPSSYRLKASWTGFLGFGRPRWARRPWPNWRLVESMMRNEIGRLDDVKLDHFQSNSERTDIGTEVTNIAPPLTPVDGDWIQVLVPWIGYKHRDISNPIIHLVAPLSSLEYKTHRLRIDSIDILP